MLSSEKLDELSDKLEQGWTLLQAPCPRCNCPLIRPPNEELSFCAKCGGFVVTESEAKVLKLSSPPEKEKATPVVERSPEDAVLVEAPPKEIMNDNIDFSNGSLPEDDEWDNYFETRLQHVDRASNAIGQKLLQGWTLLGESCQQCATPLMSLRGGEMICVMCDGDGPKKEGKKKKQGKEAITFPISLNDKLNFAAESVEERFNPKQEKQKEVVVEKKKETAVVQASKKSEPTTSNKKRKWVEKRKPGLREHQQKRKEKSAAVPVEMSSFDRLLQPQDEPKKVLSLGIQSSPVVLSSKKKDIPAPQQKQAEQQQPVPHYQQQFASMMMNSSASNTNPTSILRAKLAELSFQMQHTTEVMGIMRVADSIRSVGNALEALQRIEIPTSHQMHSICAGPKISIPVEVKNPPIQPGHEVPNVNVWALEYAEDGSLSKAEVSLREYCSKPTILFAVPAAFTPTCSNKHLPGFISLVSQFEELGFENIACISVNDPYVMFNWGEKQEAIGSVDMLADPEGNVAKALGLSSYKGPAMGTRFIRSAFVITNGVFNYIAIDEKGFEKTSAESILELITSENQL